MVPIVPSFPEITTSETDYRVYRDFGQIPGLDFAYFQNGYHYHTSRDDSAHFKPGSLQVNGENILDLVRALAESPLVDSPGEAAHSEFVFFDILSLFTIIYRKHLSTWFNLAALLACVAAYFGKVLLVSLLFLTLLSSLIYPH